MAPMILSFKRFEIAKHDMKRSMSSFLMWGRFSDSQIDTVPECYHSAQFRSVSLRSACKRDYFTNRCLIEPRFVPSGAAVTMLHILLVLLMVTRMIQSAYGLWKNFNTTIMQDSILV